MGAFVTIQIGDRVRVRVRARVGASVRVRLRFRVRVRMGELAYHLPYTKVFPMV